MTKIKLIRGKDTIKVGDWVSAKEDNSRLGEVTHVSEFGTFCEVDFGDRNIAELKSKNVIRASGDILKKKNEIKEKQLTRNKIRKQRILEEKKEEEEEALSDFRDELGSMLISGSSPKMLQIFYNKSEYKDKEYFDIILKKSISIIEEKKQRKKLEEEKKRQQQKLEEDTKKFKLTLASMLQSGSTFEKLDKYFYNHELLDSHSITKEENDSIKAKYDSIKAKYLEGYFKNKVNLELNDEQADAIQEIKNHVILKARAGSGKTRVITAKAFFLIDHEKINPDELMLLAFNKAAANEMTHRLQKDYQLKSFNNARTFHSLAYQLGLEENTELLFDKADINLNTQAQSKFIQDIVVNLMDNKTDQTFIKKLYRFFRKESSMALNDSSKLSSEDAKKYANIEDAKKIAKKYTEWRSNLSQNLTLDGYLVKSIGEKWIGDFLFEHDIDYHYERTWPVSAGGWDFKKNKTQYKPDFSLKINSNHFNFVLEHWGIDENAALADQTTPDDWNKSWSEYRDQMFEKRRYWERYNDTNTESIVSLIETSIHDMGPSKSYNRKYFENILRDKFKESGIKVNKLSQEELFIKFKLKQKAQITKMFSNYIARAKKQRLLPNKLKKMRSDLKAIDPRIVTFYELANIVYKKYIHTLDTENKNDFDGLIEKAIDTIKQTKGECEITINKSRSVTLNQLRYLMIDEYQDFSLLFSELISSIMKYNKDIKVFCVGDDWQAINAFAGSDLKYFKEFEKYFDNSIEKFLLTNYRSAQNIVRFSNQFMDGKGKKSITNITKDGHVWYGYTSKVYLEDNDENLKFRPGAKGIKNINIGITIKLCSLIVKKFISKKTILILTRTQKIDGLDIYHFKNTLFEICNEKNSMNKNDFDGHVKVMTAHGSKGQEADVVILLDVNERKFPLIHPDEILNTIFDPNCIINALDSEERLFYVAITRAKESLYLFTDESKESPYIKNIKLSPLLIGVIKQINTMDKIGRQKSSN